LQIAVAKQSLARDTQREKFTKIFEMLFSLSLDFSMTCKHLASSEPGQQAILKYPNFDQIWKELDRERRLRL